ncbi:MAG: hypothetical protein C5B50_00650 [Verrucomicrobia bacterium]|nr:MAG: hypothetical protein C5B50_00650 [Verrucomicrobiota bacterium]
MLQVPTRRRELIKFANDLIEKCRVSAGIRASYCRLFATLCETGQQDGTRSNINLLYHHLDRTASNLFSPTDLKFSIDFENDYPMEVLNRANRVSNLLTKSFERTDTDIEFGQGVFESLKYGACFLKQWMHYDGWERSPVYHRKLVMPWHMGVYREDETDLSKQAVICETSMLSLPEVWQRIVRLPKAKQLFEQIKAHASPGAMSEEPSSFFHAVLSTAVLNTGVQQNTRPIPGGIVQLNNDPNYVMFGPQIAIDVVKMHELWIQDDSDYTTIQMIEPDIIISPAFIEGDDVIMKKQNLMIPGATQSKLHPYTLIQANKETNYIWGRSELADLIKPQGQLSMWTADAEHLMGQQIDKVLAFTGFDGLTDERYGEFKANGYFNMNQGASVQDLTPAFPAELLPMIKNQIEVINMLGGFPEIMQGKGESGVRAGVHANTLMKTGSPRLRDTSLRIERQCAAAGDKHLSIMEAKDPKKYWTDGKNVKTMEETSFLLTDIPDDRRVSVDSHSSSPIFMDDHQQLIVGGLRLGIVDKHDAIDDLPFPNKEMKHKRLREKEEKEAQLMRELAQRDPEALEKIMAKKGARR